MMNWLISANSNLYDHTSSFEHFGYIDWKQGNYTYDTEDIVYIYCTKPIYSIRYKCKIMKINISFNNTRDDKEYWLDQNKYEKSKSGKYMHLELIEQIDNPMLNLEQLKSNGLAAAPQSIKKLDGELLKYIENNFSDKYQCNIFPEMLNENEPLYEGIKKQISVNKYERSSIARAKCIEYHGTTCKICGMNFKEKYGSIGESFIHIHHIVPLHKIANNYKINYKNDLIPVCPNCHAMLHRTINGKSLSMEELKGRINK